MNKIYRETYAEINLKNIYQNYKNIGSLLNDKLVIPVVKANAYGHGVIEVVDYLVKKGVNYFAVSLLEEALELRKIFSNIEILVMGVIQKEYFQIAASNEISITISNFDQLIELNKLNTSLTVHMKIDTGMNRLGFKSNEEIIEAFNIMKANKYINLEGIYTHFSTADMNKEYYNKQLNRFVEAIKLLNYKFKMVHMSNSSSMIKYEDNINFTTHTRLGISLYGLTLDEETKFLKNTYRLISHITDIKILEPGEKVGYGATYIAKEKEVIGILPIGYADGFIRQNQGGDVEIKGKRYPIVGRICMDQMFIKIDNTITKKDDIIRQITYRVPKIYIK